VGQLTRNTLRQPSHEQFVVADSADVGAVRRSVGGYAERLCADPAFAAVAAQTATELATNLLRHASPGGWILARPLPPAAVEILAVDHGPGIRDVAAAVEGRAPAPKGLGCGLAAVRRASSYFDVFTRPDRGTVILAVVPADHAGHSRAPGPPRRWAGVSIGIDEACGDGWAVIQEATALTVAVVDGLGHGVHASIATDAAIGALADHPADLDGYLAQANASMRQTRGAAVAVCRLEPDRGELRCLSVGNISARLLHSGGQNGIVSFNGTVGMRAAVPATKILQYPWPADATLVMWTDGLPSYLDLAAEADLFTHDPAVAAAALHRDHGRGRDDATVVVVRNPGTP
jgi:anti-sigma regulatory factor (Ser/Thr protein kinase)